MIWKHSVTTDLLKEAKQMGFSDEQIGPHHGNCERRRYLRENEKHAGITRVYKMVDTCSAEFEAKTPYFYSTFEEGLNSESKRSDKKKDR
ncbi:MAG: hypothetical protein NVV59_15520 [Chitinophagaceae bacterium]|nr:hypothetical protein [Chitinophagaceae bacterium]